MQIAAYMNIILLYPSQRGDEIMYLLLKLKCLATQLVVQLCHRM